MIYGLPVLSTLLIAMSLMPITLARQTTAPLARANENTGAKRDSTIRRLNPGSLNPPNGFSQLVITTAAHTIYISGQTAVDSHGNVIGPGDFRAQAKQVFENLKAALAAAGVGFSQVVKVNYYVLDMGNAPVLREVRASYLGSALPASTLVEVRKLARDEFMLEIEAVAVSAK